MGEPIKQVVISLDDLNRVVTSENKSLSDAIQMLLDAKNPGEKTTPGMYTLYTNCLNLKCPNFFDYQVLQYIYTPYFTKSINF
jgi:hypothetical protein